MDTKSKLIEYAHGKNSADSTFTDQELAGMMVKEGAVISRTSNSKTIAKIDWVGNEIVVTETTITDVTNILDGKIVFSKVETAAEIMRLSV